MIRNVAVECQQAVRTVLYGFITKQFSYENALDKCKGACGPSDPISSLKSMMDEYGSHNPSYYKNSNSKSKNFTFWSSTEDIRLITGIHKFGLNNFKAVSSYVGSGRTRSQCTQRWNRSLCPLINKSQWSQEEDSLLISSVQQFGDHSWTKVSNVLVGRTDVQCRYRYQLISKKFPRDLGIQPDEFMMKMIQNHEQKSSPVEFQSKVEYNNIVMDSLNDSSSYPDLLGMQYSGFIGTLHLLDLIKTSSMDPSSLFILR